MPGSGVTITSNKRSANAFRDAAAPPSTILLAVLAVTAPGAAPSAAAGEWLAPGRPLAPVAAPAIDGRNRLVLAQANSQSPQDTAARRFDIPAQPLSSALTLFGRQAGLQVAVDTALVAGLQTQGVEGSFTPAQALAQLLAGTDITYQFTDADTVTLESNVAQGDNGPVQLGPVIVEGEAGGDRFGRLPTTTARANNNLRVGGTLIYVGEREGNTSVPSFTLDDYTRLDLDASWRVSELPGLTISAAIENVLNEEYVLGSRSPTQIQLGRPQTFTLRAQYSF